MRAWWGGAWPALLALAILVGCTGGTDGSELTVTAPSAQPDPPALPATQAASARPTVTPDLRRAIDWQLSAGTDATHARGGVVLYLDSMVLTSVDRLCPDGAGSPAAACRIVTDDARTVMAVEVVVVNDTGLRLEVQPGASEVALPSGRRPADLFRGSTEPFVLDAGTVEGDLVWVLPLTVDDLRDRGRVVLDIATPVTPTATEADARVRVVVDI